MSGGLSAAHCEHGYYRGQNCKACASDYEVTCSRCGKVGKASAFMIEEGDEWECPPCWERCEAAERASQSDAKVEQ